MTDRLIVAYLRALLPFTTVLLIAAAAFEAYRGAYVATSFIVAYLLWILGESRITVNQPRESSAEHRTLPLYATARVATALTGALWPVATTTFLWWQLAPIVAFVAGVALRTWSIRTLGTFYSHHVVTYSDHRIVTTGPYQVLRHPAYTGMLLANLGFVIFFHNVASAVCFVTLVCVIVWRMLVEEKVLMSVDGYAEFAATRRRLIPAVW